MIYLTAQVLLYPALGFLAVRLLGSYYLRAD